MCAIYGAFGFTLDQAVFDEIAGRCRDRGRDGGGVDEFVCKKARRIWLGSWRATPTTEVETAEPQPYGAIVHNGMIANDKELGGRPGEVDSMVLPRVIDRSSIEAVAASLMKIRGSYAMAIAAPDTLYLATNYKPIYYARIGTTLYFASMARHLEPSMPWHRTPSRVKPYSVVDMSDGRTISLPRNVANPGKALVIASSGLDSTTAAYMIAAQGRKVGLLHFRYGCRAGTREALAVKAIADHLGAPFHVLDIDYSRFAGGSPLLSGDKIISGGVEGTEFAQEWVPARNLLMIAHAVAFAEANGYASVVLGNNLEESGAYPDNEEEFTHLLDKALDYAVRADAEVRLEAPLGHLMKHEIVAAGQRLGVPWHLTWSCYRGGAEHCGQCGPCFMRRTAFQRNGLTDPIFATSAKHASLVTGEVC
jgi:7-cyano-7-deazaguanine synthase